MTITESLAYLPCQSPTKHKCRIHLTQETNIMEVSWFGRQKIEFYSFIHLIIQLFRWPTSIDSPESTTVRILPWAITMLSPKVIMIQSDNACKLDINLVLLFCFPWLPLFVFLLVSISSMPNSPFMTRWNAIP